MARTIERNELADRLAEKVAQRHRDKEAAEGGLSLRSGAGDPSRVDPTRQTPAEAHPAAGGTGAGFQGGGSFPRFVGAMPGASPVRQDTIYDRVSPSEAQQVMEWWRGIATDDDRRAKKALRELHGVRERSILKRQTVQAVSDDALGGVWAPQQFVDEVIIALTQETPFADGSLIRIFPMTQRTAKFPKVKKRPSVSGTTQEETAYSKTHAEWGTVELVARKTGTIVPITEDLMLDSTVDMVAVLAQMVAEELAELRNSFVTNGSGAEEPEGVRTNSNIGTTAMTTTDDFTRAKSLIDGFMSISQRYRRNGIWLAHNDGLSLVRKLANANNDFYWTDAFGSLPASLMGRPVFENPDIPIDLGGGSDETEILFGDFRRGYVFGQRSGVEAQQDYSGDNWEKDIIQVKWRERYDGKVRDENAFIRITGVK